MRLADHSYLLYLTTFFVYVLSCMLYLFYIIWIVLCYDVTFISVDPRKISY